MRKNYEVSRIALDELHAEIKKNAKVTCRYRVGSPEMDAYIRGCMYIIKRIRQGTIDSIILQPTKETNKKTK